MPSLLDCLSDCQPKVRSDLMLFLNITSNELEQETALLREVGLNIREENEVYQLVPEMPLLNPQAISTALFLYDFKLTRTDVLGRISNGRTGTSWSPMAFTVCWAVNFQFLLGDRS